MTVAAHKVNQTDPEYPGTDLAYELAVDSYEPLIRRLDVIDGRLQAIMSFAATTIAVIPSVASTRNLSFRSPWFWIAFVSAGLVIGLGSHARHKGEIKLIHPSKLYQKWLNYQPDKFKLTFIYWAGQHWELNNNLNTWKWRWSVAITILFFLEAVALVVWVVAAHP